MANFVADAEEKIINKLATHTRLITGITNAYGFAQNPDSLGSGVIPAVVFYPSEGSQDTKAHFNRWENVINVTGLLFVAQRMSQGGTLKYLENTVLAFPGRFRAKFQEEAVIRDLLSLGMQRAVFRSWRYGAGGLLNYQGIDYIGLVLEWEFRGTN